MIIEVPITGIRSQGVTAIGISMRGESPLRQGAFGAGLYGRRGETRARGSPRKMGSATTINAICQAGAAPLGNEEPCNHLYRGCMDGCNAPV